MLKPLSSSRAEHIVELEIFNEEDGDESSEEADVSVDDESLYVDFEDEVEEDSNIESVENFGSDFDRQNMDVIDYFHGIRFDNVITYGEANLDFGDINLLNLDEADEYDFSRPEQEESQLVRAVGENRSRPSGNYLRNLDIELGNSNFKVINFCFIKF